MIHNDKRAIHCGVIQKQRNGEGVRILTSREGLHRRGTISRHSKNNWNLQRHRKTTNQQKLAGLFGTLTRCQNWRTSKKIARMVRRGRASPCYMGRAKRQQVETIGTTTHKNKIRHTQKQSGTTTHSNKKTLLKITNKTKQKGETTHKKTTFIIYL